MKSYYAWGIGARFFLKNTEEVKKIITNYFEFECGCYFPMNTRRYLELIDYACVQSEKLFERDPAMYFQIELLTPKKELYIRVKNNKGETITILTAYFSKPAAEVEIHCRESQQWSIDAFRYLFKE